MSFTIKRKIGAGIGLLLLLMISIGIIALFQMDKLLLTLNNVSQTERAESEAAYEMEIYASKISSSIINYLDHQNPENIERFRHNQHQFLRSLDLYRHSREHDEDEFEFQTEADFELKLMNAYQSLHATAEKLIKLQAQSIEILSTLTIKSEALDDLVDDKMQKTMDTPSSTEEEFQKQDLTLEFEIHFHGIERNLDNYLKVHDPQDLKIMAERQVDYKDFLNQYNALELSTQERLISKQMESLFDDYMELIDKVIDLEEKKLHHLNTFNRQCNSLETFLRNEVLLNTKQEIIYEHNHAIGLAKQTKIGLLIALISGILLGLASWKVLSSMLIQRTQNLLYATQQILDGDLSIRLPVGTRDELGTLSESFNTMTAQLEEAQATEQAFRSELEIKVAERTEELKKEINRRKLVEINRRETEQRLRQAEKMETVGQLAGGVAHDFNNFLQVILGHAELVKEVLTEQNTLHDLEQITDATKKARDLTQQLLIFSRRQSMQMDTININELTEDSLKMLIRLIGEHIEVDFIYGSKLRSIRGDWGQIQQVLMNLAINARDAMSDGGKLTIKTENIVVTKNQADAQSGMRAGRFVLLSVTDTGCGIDQESLKHIYEPFFTSKSVGGGPGLGLATVFGIVKGHNGFIQAYSEVGKGTLFKLFFPVAEQQSAALVAPTPEKPAFGGNETILLAEDEEDVRLLAERLLRKSGYNVLTATNGLEAVEMFKDHAEEIKLLVLDVIMPKLGGKETYEQIKQMSKNTIPALFCSGYVPSGTQLQFSRELGTELIQKPYTAGVLLKKIRNTLDRS